MMNLGLGGPNPVVRVRHADLSPEELAALTAVLLLRTAAEGIGPCGPVIGRAAAGWSRTERRRAFADPRTWQLTD